VSKHPPGARHLHASADTSAWLHLMTINEAVNQLIWINLNGKCHSQNP
jgi:hypothetical protein